MDKLSQIDMPAPTEVFKLWFASDSGALTDLAKQLQPLAFELLILFFIISIGIFALKAFEGLDIQERVWTFILCGIFITLWPLMVVGVKEIIDGLNGYLQSLYDLKNFSQEAVDRGLIEEMALRFSAPEMTQADPNDPANQGLLDLIKSLGSGNLVEWMRVTGAHWWLGFINSLLTAAAIASRVVVQLLYNIYFYLYLLLGPIVIARAVFSENLESFLELVKEFVVVLLWPTMYVILAGTLVKTWGASSGTFINSISGAHIQLGLTLAFIILTFLVPPMTKKFAVAIGTSIVTPFMRFGGIAMGLTAGQGLLGMAGRSLGVAHIPHLAHSAEKYISLGEIVHEHQHAEHLHHAAHNMHHALHHAQHALHHAHEEHEHGHHGHDDHGHDEHGHADHSHADHGHEDHSAHHGEHGASHGHGSHSEHGGGHEAGGSHADVHHPSEPLPTLLADEPGPYFSRIDKRARQYLEKFKWKRSPKNDEVIPEVIESIVPDEKALAKIRDRALDFLAPKDSDKMHDLEKMGIHFADLKSTDPKILLSYVKRVKQFHLKYGWLYDFEGRFWGTDLQRPIKGNPLSDREVLS